MKKIQKKLSVVLAVMMVLCMFTALPFSASAAETSEETSAGNKINVTSNVTDPVSYDYNAQTEQVVVTYLLKADHMIVNAQSSLTYDSKVLKLASTTTTNTKKKVFPVFQSSIVWNPSLTNQVLFNCSSLDLFNFKSENVYCTFTFDVVGSGDTTVNLNVDYLTGTEAETYNEFFESEKKDIDYIYDSANKVAGAAFTANAVLVQGEEPTTAPQPTTATQPTTVTQPTTAPATKPTQPATEPTTTPSGDGATIKFAAPTSQASRYNWSKPVLFYGNTQSVDKSTKLSMTATSEKYYTTEVGSNTLLTTNGWTVYELKISKDQAAAINSSKFVGFATADGVNRTTLVSGSNVLKAGVDTYTAKYGTTANTVAALDGKTFVIRDSAYGATSSVSFVGYWVSDFVTVRAAAPLAATPYSTWDNVDLYYGNTTAFDSMTKLSMINTGDTTKVSSLNGNMTIKTGRWYIYAITLDKATASAVENAKYVGFNKTDAVNRTAILKNVLFAKTNTFDGNYNSKARTLSELDGQLFVIKGMTAKSSSVATYTGEWETKDVYTQGKDDTVTLYFAAPKGVKNYASWDTGVQLYYSNDNVYTNAERIDMKKVNETKKVTVDSSKLKTLKSGNWDVYSVTLTVDQIKAIDNCQSVGFVKKGSFNRTSYTAYRNICKASKMDGDSTYSGVRESIETFDGYMFVINSCYTPSNENISLTGSWVVK